MWPAVATLEISYFLLLLVIDDTGALFVAPALAAAVGLWQFRRLGGTPTEAPSEPMSRARLTGRVLGLTVLAYLTTGLVSGLVGGFVPPDSTAEMRLRIATVIALPINLLLLQKLGGLTVKWLPVAKPFPLLGLVAVSMALISVALRPLAELAARGTDVAPPRDLVESVPRTVAVTALIFCALAFGNLMKRRALAEPEVTEPEVTGPQVAGPQVAGPQVAGPQVAGPQVAGPRVTGPPVTEPQVADEERP